MRVSPMRMRGAVISTASSVGRRSCTPLRAWQRKGKGLAGCSMLVTRACARSLTGLLGLSECAHSLTPEQEYGRAEAAHAASSCDSATVASLASQLHPRLTIGPPDPGISPAPELAAAPAELGPSYNLAWEPQDPDVVVGRLVISVDHATTGTIVNVPDTNDAKQRVAATQHRFVARPQAEVVLGGRTRLLRAVEETRDVTWPASPNTLV